MGKRAAELSQTELVDQRGPRRREVEAFAARVAPQLIDDREESPPLRAHAHDTALVDLVHTALLLLGARRSRCATGCASGCASRCASGCHSGGGCHSGSGCPGGIAVMVVHGDGRAGLEVLVLVPAGWVCRKCRECYEREGGEQVLVPAAGRGSSAVSERGRQSTRISRPCASCPFGCCAEGRLSPPKACQSRSPSRRVRIPVVRVGAGVSAGAGDSTAV